jgi:hypothetical protein
MFIPDIPVIHRLPTRFSARRDSKIGANVLLSPGSGLAGNGKTIPATAKRNAAQVFGRKPKEARSGQPEGRSARQRCKPKPNPLSFEGPAEPEAPGRRESRKDAKKLRFCGVR